MSDFYGSITSTDFKYCKPINYTNNSSSDQNDLVVKLFLNANNFNNTGS